MMRRFSDAREQLRDAITQARAFVKPPTHRSRGANGIVPTTIEASPKSKVQGPRSGHGRRTLDFGLWTLDMLPCPLPERFRYQPTRQFLIAKRSLTNVCAEQFVREQDGDANPLGVRWIAAEAKTPVEPGSAGILPASGER